MREKTVEQKLVKAVKAAGGICPKWTAPGFDGLPDRIVLLPGGRMGFVEVKAPGKKARPLQESRHGLLRSFGVPGCMCWMTRSGLEGSLMKYEPHDYQVYASEYIERP